jgi:hypothetical protein
MEESAQKGTEEVSVFQTKYNEFVEDLMGALPEYSVQIQAAKALDESLRLTKFQEEVKVGNSFGGDIEDVTKNPGKVLPGVEISDSVWSSLSENTKKAIWEYVRILSVCSFMEAGFSDNSKPAWMDDVMNEMKDKLGGMDFQNIFKKFMTFMKPDGQTGEGDEGKSEGSMPAGFEKLFENGFPKIPEKFLSGHMARLAQEIVKDIKPEDLGISQEMINECEKNPSRAFDILFKVFGGNPGIIQKVVQKIGKRLQQKIASGSIRPQEIAREAEELMKEFSSNSSFVDMMDGIKSAFGFTDMDMAKQAGRESSARLAMVKDRLKKKASEKEAKKAANQVVSVHDSAVAKADAAMERLLLEESKTKKPDTKKQLGKGGKK